MSPALVSLGVVLVVLLTWLAVRLTAWRRPARVGETWGCGRVVQTPRMEYTSTAFAEPLRRVFAEIYRPTQDLTIDVHAGTRYVVRGIAYRSEILPWFERYLYAPALALVVRWAGHAQAIQLGSVHAYLAYLVVTLLALLGLLTVSRP
jgi:hydrogenase-4 component B